MFSFRIGIAEHIVESIDALMGAQSHRFGYSCLVVFFFTRELGTSC